MQSSLSLWLLEGLTPAFHFDAGQIQTEAGGGDGEDNLGGAARTETGRLSTLLHTTTMEVR